jgi:hypothetical protein
MQNRLSSLIERGKLVNDLKWHMSCSGISKDAFKRVESSLKNILPADFEKISLFVSYEGSNSMQFLQFDALLKATYGVIDCNLEIRQQYLKESNGKSDMSHILVLADDDGGSVFMITQDSPEKPTPVIWCDAGDMYHYSINGIFPHPHDEWLSFTDFFEYLVEKEEEKLKEDNL